MKIIKCNDSNVYKVVSEQIKNLGFKSDLNHIDVSDVTNMSELFEHSSFNGNISSWNVSNVKDFSWMFNNADKFVSNISNWKISEDAKWQGMFVSCPIPLQNKPRFPWIDLVRDHGCIGDEFQIYKPLGSYNGIEDTQRFKIYSDKGRNPPAFIEYNLRTKKWRSDFNENGPLGF